MTIPQDIRSAWFNPIRRLQSVACQNNGIAIIRMSFVINENGDPVVWTEPKMTKVEPKVDKETIIELLTRDET